MAFRMASTDYPSLCFTACQETRWPPGLSEGVVQTPLLMQEGEPQTKRRKSETLRYQLPEVNRHYLKRSPGR